MFECEMKTRESHIQGGVKTDSELLFATKNILLIF